MRDATRRVVAVPITLVTACGVALLIAEIFRGVVFGGSHADPVWLILGAAWVAAMLAATVALWTGSGPRSRLALWTGAVAAVVGAAVLAVGAAGVAQPVLVAVLGVGLAAGLLAAATPGSRRRGEPSS